MQPTTLQPPVEQTPDATVSHRPAWPTLVLFILGLGLYLLPEASNAWPDILPLDAAVMGTFWGPMACAALLAIWWLVFGPAPARWRWVTLLVAAALGTAAMVAADSSARFGLAIWGLALATGLAALSLLLTGGLSGTGRAAVAGVFGILALIPWNLVRVEGVTGEFKMHAVWRWTPKAEDQATAYFANRTNTTAVGLPQKASEGDWPMFRGPRQDNVIAGASFGDAGALREAWRHPVGPAWSSFCVVGDWVFTQEQRDKHEVVSCYNVRTGEQAWAHLDEVRHYDTPSGAGPRATPTFHDGKIIAQGGTSIVVCLDAATGNRLWRTDLREGIDQVETPFGVSGSPVVVGDRVLLHPGFQKGARLVALDLTTGKKAWESGEGTLAYSTPHLAMLGGVEQVLIFDGNGLFGHDPATGKELWRYEWKATQTAPAMCQPLLLPGDRVMIGGGNKGAGSRCVRVKRAGEGWAVEEVWKSKFSPAFCDTVLHEGHIYGLDGKRLACVEAETGKVVWKTGDYGSGQVVLVGGRLLVQSEMGEITLVEPSPQGRKELGSPLIALKDKTWNHPVVARGRLFVRNDREVACYDLPGPRAAGE